MALEFSCPELKFVRMLHKKILKSVNVVFPLTLLVSDWSKDTIGAKPEHFIAAKPQPTSVLSIHNIQSCSEHFSTLPVHISVSTVITVKYTSAYIVTVTVTTTSVKRYAASIS